MRRPKLEEMTLREKIAQTLLVRQCDLLLRADKDYMEARDPEEAFEIIERVQFGGIWAHGNLDVNHIPGSLSDSFDFTVDSFKEWKRKADAVAKYPMFYATDAFVGKAFKGLSNNIRCGLAVGAANSEELSFELGRATAREHKFVGCNWVWSPVVDQYPPETSGICRVFASKPDMLRRHSNAFIKGMQSEGVAAGVKHFPGSDGIETRDGHIITVNMRCTKEEWKANQGKTFQCCFDEGVYTVMTGAKAFPAADSTTKNGRYLPTSLSKAIVTDLLKGEMGFDGVVITDDVSMGGYTSFYGHDDLYVELLKAGNDVLLGVGIDALDIVAKGVEDGRLSEERINDACRRIFDLKEKLGLFDEDRKNEDTLEGIKRDTAEVLNKIAENGVTLLRDRIGLVPVSKEKIKKVTIIAYSHYDGTLKDLEAMKSAFEERGAEVVLRDRLETFSDVKNVAAESDLIVYAGYIDHHKPKGAPSFYGDVFWSLRYSFTEGLEKSVGVSLGVPYLHYNFMDDALVFANLYSPSAEIQRAFVAALYGEKKFLGVSPVDMTGKL